MLQKTAGRADSRLWTAPRAPRQHLPLRAGERGGARPLPLCSCMALELCVRVGARMRAHARACARMRGPASEGVALATRARFCPRLPALPQCHPSCEDAPCEGASSRGAGCAVVGGRGEILTLRTCAMQRARETAHRGRLRCGTSRRCLRADRRARSPLGSRAAGREGRGGSRGPCIVSGVWSSEVARSQNA